MSRSIHLRSALIGGLVAGLIVTALPAMAAVVGDALELGTTNTINKTTTLRVGSRRAALAVTNTRTGPALQVKGQRNVVKITAEAGKSPIWVNAAAGTAKNLSADKLDGLDSSAFLGASAKAVDAELLDGMDSTAFLVDATAFLGATAQAADSNLLDGLDSTAFLGATSKAADANKLDGRDSTAFLRVAFDADDNLPDGDDSAAFVSNVGEPLSVSITAPTAGWLVMTGTVDAVSTTHTDDYNCRLRVDGSQVVGTRMDARIDGATTSNMREDCTTHGVQEVAAGAHTVTFRLEAVSDNTDFYGGSLSAMFVPFDGTGAISTCTTTPCPLP